MKINENKISKLQTGGYLQYRPLTRQPDVIPEQETAPAAKQGRAAKDDSGIDDKGLEKLLGNGITNDVMAFSDQMKLVENEYASLSDVEKEGPKGRHLRQQLKGNFGELNALLRSKVTFDNAIAKASAAGGLEEFAVVQGGFVVKQADGNLGKISFSQFAKDKASGEMNYKTLTNSELAREREYNKGLIGNNSVFSILEYSKGIHNVQKEVLDIAGGLGKTSNSTSTGAYDEGTVEAMREAKIAAGQGLFKVKESQSMSTNKPQIERAKQVMWSMLPDNSKNVLRARAAMLETDPSKVEQRAAMLAMDLLDPRVDQAQTSVTDMAYSKGAKATGGKGGSDPLGEVGEREAAINGKTQQEHMELLSDYGVDIQTRMNVLPKDDITRKNKDGVIVPTTVASSELGKYAYVNQATALNGDKIDPTQTMFTGEAYYTRIPVRKQANGGLTLDEEGAKKLASAENEIRNLPPAQDNKMNRERIMQKHGANALNIQEVVIAEAASFDDKYTFWGLRGKRDSKYFKDADGATKQLLQEVVDPDGKGATNWIDYKSYKHLVIIPSKGERTARYADKNALYAPKSGWDLTNPLDQTRTAGKLFPGSAFQTTGAQNQFGIDQLDK